MQSVSLHPSQRNGTQKNTPVVNNRHTHQASVTLPSFLLNTLGVYLLQKAHFEALPKCVMLTIVGSE
jgi:hypothetical protein